MENDHIYEVPLGDIKLEGINVRSDLDTENSKKQLQELAESIREHGLMQPIVLMGEHGSPPYDVVVGQRRFLAHKILGKNTIKAIFAGEIDQTNALLLSLSENICRQELNYSDLSNAITNLYKSYDKDVRKVQEKLGISIPTIRKYIKINEQATDKIKKLLEDEIITLTDAKRVIDAAQGDLEKADELIDQIKELTKYEKDRIVEYGKRHPAANASKIVTEAKKPKFEETLILNLPNKVNEALRKAASELLTNPERITMDALINWLKNNDYLNE